MWIAELKKHPGQYAVSPDYGDEGQFTISPALACVWITKEQCEAWARHHGGKWQPVEKPL